MSTKELIETEIGRMDESQLAELYQVVIARFRPRAAGRGQQRIQAFVISTGAGGRLSARAPSGQREIWPLTTASVDYCCTGSDKISPLQNLPRQIFPVEMTTVF